MKHSIVLDPGHGGSDNGASGNGIIEKNLTLDISKYMYNEFKKLGIPVSITREDDVTLSPSNRVKKILSYYGNNPNVIVISNHINAGGGEGAEVIYALRDKSALADTVLNEIENIKGEIVVVVEGNHELENYDDIDVIEHVNMFIDDGLSQMEAIKKVAKLRNVPKSEIYNKFHR